MQHVLNWVSIFSGLAGIASLFLQFGPRFAKYRSILQNTFIFCMGLAIGLFSNVAIHSKFESLEVDANKMFVYAMTATVMAFDGLLILIAVFTQNREQRDVAYSWAQGVAFFLAVFIMSKV